MPEPNVPDDVREFIIRHIATVAQFEALLLVASRPDDCWSLQQVARRLYASEEATARGLNQLRAGGLLICADGHYSFNASAENVDMLRRLREVYARYLIEVTDVIHNKPARMHQPPTSFEPKGTSRS